MSLKIKGKVLSDDVCKAYSRVIGLKRRENLQAFLKEELRQHQPKEYSSPLRGKKQSTFGPQEL
jgi:hypothetical protein